MLYLAKCKTVYLTRFFFCFLYIIIQFVENRDITISFCDDFEKLVIIMPSIIALPCYIY